MSIYKLTDCCLSLTVLTFSENRIDAINVLLMYLMNSIEAPMLKKGAIFKNTLLIIKKRMLTVEINILKFTFS